MGTNKNILEGKRLEIMKSVLFAEQEELHEVMTEQLSTLYKDIFSQEQIGIYAAGDIPVILLAHFDTVHKVKPTEETLFYDTAKNQMICINNGIGADCRAGLFNIIEILRKGYRPHIFLSWNEEIGCVGTEYFTRLLESNGASSAVLNESLADINFAIQFDRRGFGEAVYYDLDNQDFEDYISSFGFETQWGSFTDIAVLCPSAGFAGVNLSTGYTNEHTRNEVLHVDEMLKTQEKAIKILEDQMVNPQFFEYREFVRSYKSKKGYNSSYSYPDEDIYSYPGKASDLGALEEQFDDFYGFYKDEKTTKEAKEGDGCFICRDELEDGVNWDSTQTNLPSFAAITCFTCRETFFGKENYVPEKVSKKQKS